jgi:hypothetical protein
LFQDQLEADVDGSLSLIVGVEDSESELAEADWDAHRPISNNAAYMDNDLVKAVSRLTTRPGPNVINVCQWQAFPA